MQRHLDMSQIHKTEKGITIKHVKQMSKTTYKTHKKAREHNLKKAE